MQQYSFYDPRDHKKYFWMFFLPAYGGALILTILLLATMGYKNWITHVGTFLIFMVAFLGNLSILWVARVMQMRLGEDQSRDGIENFVKHIRSAGDPTQTLIEYSNIHGTLLPRYPFGLGAFIEGPNPPTETVYLRATIAGIKESTWRLILRKSDYNLYRQGCLLDYLQKQVNAPEV